jgi:predicted nucleic acid-binding protein
VLIFLDTTLLWLLVHPGGGSRAKALRQAMLARAEAGDQIAVAEICDYEARRELIRKGATRQIDNLDRLVSESVYVPLDTGTMRDAAALWAQLRRRGRPTAPDEALDGDVILGAQAARQGSHLVVTENLRHLDRICNAIEWQKLLA